MHVQLVVASGTHTGKEISVTAEKFIIGRATDCHLKAKSELISRYHCAILVGEEVIVRDLGSRNGVRVNGEKISMEQKLAHGDLLTLEPLEFRVHIETGGESVPTDSNISTIQLSNSNARKSVGPADPTVFAADDFQALEQK